MKVVFLQDVPNVAKAGEIKEVAAGYGRNFLIPRKLAALASPQAMSQVETIDKTEARENAELGELAAQLEGKEVSLKAKAGAKERIYGSITSADIAAELESTTGIEVDKRKIELDEPIRQLGSYEVSIRLAKDILPKIKVNVTEEEKPKAEKKPAKKKAAKEKAPAKAKKTTKKAEKAPETEKKTTKKPAKKATAKREEKPKAEKKPAKKAKTTKKEEKAKA
jgi:large subunit ribosomal protein L9